MAPTRFANMASRSCWLHPFPRLRIFGICRDLSQPLELAFQGSFLAHRIFQLNRLPGVYGSGGNCFFNSRIHQSETPIFLNGNDGYWSGKFFNWRALDVAGVDIEFQFQTP